jgi:hypothetical protein
MAAINLAERDGLHSRLSDVRCPVLWLHVSFYRRAASCSLAKRRLWLNPSCDV